MDSEKLINKVVEHFTKQTNILIDLHQEEIKDLEFIVKTEQVHYRELLTLIIQFKFYDILSVENGDRLRREIDIINNNFNDYVLKKYERRYK